MRFLADMGIALRIVEWLRTEGHDTIHLREEGLHRLPNGAIFDKAAAERRILLTFDLDFGEILALTTTPHVLERLGKVLGDSGRALEEGAVVVVEESPHRVRRLPLGG